MSDEAGTRLKIVPLRGKLKGRFGWVLLTDEVLIQCLKAFPSKEEAERDAGVFLEQDPSEWQRVH